MPMKSHFQIALFLALLAVKQAARVAINKIEVMLDDNITSSPAFYIVQLADPQLGMLKMAEKTKKAAKDFSAEKDNLKHAVTSILKLRPPPAAVVMSGDMQNFWSKRGANNLKLSDLGSDYGNFQAISVKLAMAKLEKENIPVKYTPGNHDLDDVVDMEVLNRYKNLWGDDSGASVYGDYYSFQIENVFFMSINSQMYFSQNHEQPVIEHEQAQTAWIRSTLSEWQGIENPPSAIVILTHIPPFIGSYGEQSGWANWETSFKEEILGLFYGTTGFKKVPELWLCGHFHGNAHAYHRMNNWPIDVVTTGSVGTTMLWNGSYVPAPNFYGSEHASTIAKAVSGGAAFVKHIHGGSADNVKARLSTSKDLSGLRVVQFYTNGQYRHKWFTLNEFERVSKRGTIDAEVMSGSEISYSAHLAQQRTK